MDLALPSRLSERFKSWPQKIRVMSEAWLCNNQFCPSCGQMTLTAFENNRPVADFICRGCFEQFELKALKGKLKRKVVDGAYDTMMARLAGTDNPNFLFLTYDRPSLAVTDLQVVPKHFLTDRTIEPRKALSPNARRAGWRGCNILIEAVPLSGRIDLIRAGQSVSQGNVVTAWRRMLFLREQPTPSGRTSLLEVLRCIETLQAPEFTLMDIYALESELAKTFSGNNNVRAKIRQQLQLLRDNGYLDFVGRGRYRCKH